ncbi:MAG: hypothetical protein M1459_02510 [Patescibacteria group bacterium]|nr:hypothetical protein [Patescibacteria group bacterium]
MNTINDVQLRTAGSESSAPATTTNRPTKPSGQGFILMKSGHRDRRFGAKPLLGKDTCGY